ncbi:MAG: trypsin-like serine protease [Pseudomonadota bacterium]
MKAFRSGCWAPFLITLASCSSSGGFATGVPDGQTGVVASPIIGGKLDSQTHGVVALAEAISQTNVAVFCSGSLLAPNLVLTARHCIAEIGDGTSESVDCATTKFGTVRDPRSLYVSTEATPQTTKGTLYAVSQILQAPGGTNVCGFDMALLILSKNVPSTAATPIDPALDTETTVNESFSAVGFGLQDPNDVRGTTAGTRMRFDGAQVYCVGNSCPSGADTTANEFVGASPVCSGDSGGPALNAKGQVFGVTSRGDQACTYALYSNVASWPDFIRSTAKTAATMGGYTAPGWATGMGSGTPVGSGGAAGTSAGGSSAAGNGGSSAGSAGAPSGGMGGSAGTVVGGSGGAGGSTGGAGGSTAAGASAMSPTSVTPAVDPLGQACSSKNDCQGTYQCYSASSTPPGTCVPACTTESSPCPANYSCNTTLKVCTPPKSVVHQAKASANCSVSSRSHNQSGTGAWVAALALSCAWFGRRRRSAT